MKEPGEAPPSGRLRRGAALGGTIARQSLRLAGARVGALGRGRRAQEEALAEVLTEFLPIVDDFERALEAARWLRDLDGVLQGLTVIHRRLLELLARFNVRPMETLGRPFDPTRHEAFAVEPTDEYEENTIIDEYQRGYMMGDRLLRPARVKVAVRPTSKRA